MALIRYGIKRGKEAVFAGMPPTRRGLSHRAKSRSDANVIIRCMEIMVSKLERKRCGGSTSRTKTAFNLHGSRYESENFLGYVSSYFARRQSIMSCNGNLALPISRPRVCSPSNRRFGCYQHGQSVSWPEYGRLPGHA